MNKTILNIALLLTASITLLSSCEKWLEATSSSQIADEKLFSTRSGFHEALTGIYLQMGQPATYGANYTFKVNDLLTCPYVPHDQSLIKSIQQHLYTNALVQPYVENMWGGGYAIIANVNKTLFELERRRDIIADELEYNLIKGELLAARAYVHFDMMRLFGLESWTGANADKVTIPYVTEYSSVPSQQRTYTQTLELLVQDLSAALECLGEDPVRGYKSDNFETAINTDGYWTDRQKHLNYYAVEALLARVNLWKRDYVSAAQLASDVIDGAISHGLAHWLDVEAFQHEVEYDYRDWTFSCEHLFSLEITNIYDNLSEFFFSPNGSQSIFLDDIAMQNLFVSTEDGIDDLQEDVRGPAGLLKYNARGYQFYKFYGSDHYFEAYRGRMPMIKLSEMFLILAEAAFRTFDYEGATNYIDQIRSHRGLSTTIGLSHDLWAGQLTSEEVLYAACVAQEYLREFMGEGQYLYALKRLGAEFSLSALTRMNSFIPSSLHSVSDLVVPYPVAETTYGRIQE